MLRERVIEAKELTENVYKGGKKLTTQHLLENISVSAIRPVRFNDRRGYFFAFDLNGVIKMYPPDPKIEGKEASVVFDNDRIKVINKFIAIAKKGESGFFEYNWLLPGDSSNKLQKKISFVTPLKSYNWVLGAGGYHDDFGEAKKENVLKEISRIMEPDQENYFFVYQLHSINEGKNFATMILNPNRPDLVGKKISDDARDAKGIEFRKDFLRGLRNHGEVFVTYWYKKPGKEETTRKLSYFKFYPEWKWVVAKSTALDRLDQIISNQEQEIKTRMKREIFVFLFFFLLTLIFAIFLALTFSRRIDAIFQKYKNVQEQQRKELEKLNRTLQKQATTDALTGLYNRKHYNVRLEEEISCVDRYNHRISLILFDVDHFKKVNDDFGHIAGDRVLVDLSKLILTQIRKADVFARWGGEEFIVLLLESDKDTALKLAEKYCQIVSEYKFSINRKVTCSFGVTEYTRGESAEELLHRADECLYKAKNSGRNCVVAN